MRRRYYDDACLKHMLGHMRRTGERNPRLYLSEYQKELVEIWGYRATPYLYKIYTKAIPGVEHKSGLLKEIHRSRVREGKRTIMRCLKAQEKNELNEAGVKYIPHIHEIHLKG